MRIAAKSLLTATAIISLLTFVVGCASDSAAQHPENDTSVSPDEDAARNDDTFAVLTDAILLCDTEGNGSDAASDVKSNDSSWTDTTVSSDTTDWTDTQLADVPSVYDVVADDSGTDAAADVYTPTGIRVPCPQGDMDCPDDLFCENNSLGEPLCRAHGKCSRDGLVDLVDVVAEMMLSDGNSPVFIKISTMVHMGPPSCTWIECDPSNMCCNQCFASLMVGDSDFPIVLWGKDPEVSCMGNNCNLNKNCHPLIPDQEYLIWGTAQVVGGRAQINLEGFCAVDELSR